MRVAFVPAARLLSESTPNGEALIACALLRRLAERGHDLIAYCERSELDPIPGVDVRQVSAQGATAALGRLNFARRIARDLAAERVDVAHLLFPFTTHEGYTFAGGAPLVAGPVNLPWPDAVATRPATVARRAAKAATDVLERRAHARTIARAARILVTGASSKAAIPEAARDKTVELPFGVDMRRFEPVPPADEATILFLSVLQQRKGIEVLLRAMPDVLRKVPRARLVIAGDDPHRLRERLEEIARTEGVADKVEFTGPVAPVDVASTYQRATVLCQPSFGEPFGMTIVEAMACGLPVVGTSAGGARDAIVDGHGGRLVPAGDARLLADALCSVLERPEAARQMGAFNRARAEERYALDRIVDRIETIYTELAGRPHEGTSRVA